VARHYEALGGMVRWHGKPQPRIYDTCLGRLGLPPGRILAVGDSLPHDVAGALGAGVPCAWVAGGVHAAEVGAHAGLTPDPALSGVVQASRSVAGLRAALFPVVSTAPALARPRKAHAAATIDAHDPHHDRSTQQAL
jgi:beta-phosphoglucomutase-like phosphatase (HAD superfamily)